MTHRTSRAPYTFLAHARQMLRGVRMLWGAPVDIADLEYVTRREHARMAEWIHAIERFVRLVITTMALGLRLAAPDRPRARRKRGRRERVLRLYPMNRPSLWPVWFRVSPLSYSGAHACPRRTGRSPPRVVPTNRLAFRLEAITRAIADPRPIAQRFARRLARARAANARSNDPVDLVAWLRPPVPPLTPAFRAAQPAWGECSRQFERRSVWLDSS